MTIPDVFLEHLKAFNYLKVDEETWTKLESHYICNPDWNCKKASREGIAINYLF